MLNPIPDLPEVAEIVVKVLLWAKDILWIQRFVRPYNFYNRDTHRSIELHLILKIEEN